MLMRLIERTLKAVSLQILRLTNSPCKKVFNPALICHEVTVSKTTLLSYIFNRAFKKG